MEGFKGEKSVFYVKMGDVWYPISCEVSSNLSESVEMVDTTTRDNTGGWKTSYPTRQSYSISFNGMMVTEVAYSIISYWTLVHWKRSRRLVEWKQEISSLGAVISGKAYISAINITNNVEEFIMFDITFEGFGAINYL